VGTPCDPLELFADPVRAWFQAVFPGGPTAAQRAGWPAIAAGQSTLILAPTGSGKTLAAFLWCLHRLMFEPVPAARQRCRVLYISPLKALAIDVERNLRTPLVGIARPPMRRPSRSMCRKSPSAPAIRRRPTVRASSDSGDLLITTPESLYLLLTPNARAHQQSVETVIIDGFTRSCRPSAAHPALSSSASRLSRRARCSASGCPQRSGRSTRSRASWAAPAGRRHVRRRPVPGHRARRRSRLHA
jgi:ATP-dependent Lhr-like helicase